MSHYLLNQAWDWEKERLESIQAVHDPITIRHLEALRVEKGWRCAEVGAGAGSIANWLSERIGDSGLVVATDIDTRFLAALEQANLEVRRHDIVGESLEEEAYDLVHARLLLMHLSDREQAQHFTVVDKSDFSPSRLTVHSDCAGYLGHPLRKLAYCT